MIIILSPAKTLNFEPSDIEAQDLPKFRKEAISLINILKGYDSKGIQKLMHVSEKIADLNVKRYHSYSSRFTDKNSKAALLTFNGDVYRGLMAEHFSKEDLLYAQDRLRILSGLYGILKPLDKMQAYRLEMGTDLKNEFGKNLYDFWGDKITKTLRKDLTKVGGPLVNLASIEYSKSIKLDQIKEQIITPNFKEYRGDNLRFISFNAKKARGMMSSFIIKNRIESIDDLKSFDYEDYRFSPEHSDDKNFLFVR